MSGLAIALALSVELGATYPIPPQPLRWLYRDADLVVVAKAGETIRLEKDPESWWDSKVVLAVEKVLKGTCEKNQATVYYCAGMVCPAPDEYPQGRPLLVFLRWNPKRNGYHAPGLSYGSKALGKEVLELYVRRLEELAKIPEEAEGEKPGKETLEWLVRCIEQPDTRWEGAYEFCAGRTRRSKKQEDLPRIPVDALSKDQLKRAVDSLLGTAHLSWDDSYLIAMLREVRDERIDTFLATELRYEYALGLDRWSGTLMSELAPRLKLEGAKELIEQHEKGDDKARIEIVGRFLELVEKK